MPEKHRYPCFVCGLTLATQKGRRCRSCYRIWRHANYGTCACGRPILKKSTGLCEACTKLEARKTNLDRMYQGSEQQRQDFRKIMDGLIAMLTTYRKPYAKYLRYKDADLTRSQSVIAAETLLILAQESLPAQHYRYLLWAVNKDAPAGERLPQSLYEGNENA
jgi:hypothetical protein